MFHLNFKNWFDFCNGYCNGWNKISQIGTFVDLLIFYACIEYTFFILVIFVLQEMLNNETKKSNGEFQSFFKMFINA